MSAHDWNGNGHRDSFDSFMTQHVMGDSFSSPASSSADGGSSSSAGYSAFGSSSPASPESGYSSVSSGYGYANKPYKRDYDTEMAATLARWEEEKREREAVEKERKERERQLDEKRSRTARICIWTIWIIPMIVIAVVCLYYGLSLDMDGTIFVVTLCLLNAYFGYLCCKVGE